MRRRFVLPVVLALAGAAAAGYVAWRYFLPEESHARNDALPREFANATTVRSGTFAGGDAAHRATGTVRLLDSGGGAVLRFEGYDATAGPDVYFYLTESAAPDGQEQVEGRGLRLLVPGEPDGHATARGTFTVPIPDGVDVTKYHGVATWCDRFDVLFGSAGLA